MKERSLVTVIILAIVLAVIGILTWINFLTIPHVSGGAEFRVLTHWKQHRMPSG